MRDLLSLIIVKFFLQCCLFIIMEQVDMHIQQLDLYLRKFDEDLRRGTQIHFIYFPTVLSLTNDVWQLLC